MAAQQRTVQLSINESILNGIDENYRSSIPIEFELNLLNLAYAIGTCRSVASTQSNKIPLALDFLELFINNPENQLRVTINDDQYIEQKQDISKYLGEALSLLIAEKLYKLDKSTIKRIRRRYHDSKPDFVGFNQAIKVVWEAKGSTDAITQGEIDHAKEQKAKEPANFAFACFTRLRSEDTTQVFIEDPPALPLHDDDLERQLSRVMHYVNAFRFIGQSELSQKYFSLMRKRFIYDRNFPEFNEKEHLFSKLRFESPRLKILGKNYVGAIDKIGSSVFLFSGFDENLLTVQGFLNFTDYPENTVFNHGRSTFSISRDGICFGYTKDFDNFLQLGRGNLPIPSEIPYYLERFRIRDLDFLFQFQLVNFIEYLLTQERFEIIRNPKLENQSIDLLVKKRKMAFAIEIKKNVILKTFDTVRKRKTDFQPVLVTLKSISDEDIAYAQEFNVVIIDRERLRAIISRRKTFSKFLLGLLGQF